MEELEEINYITQLYSKLTFTEVYGKQIGFVLFVTIIEIIAIVYFYLFKNSKIYKENWSSVRCDWTVMPFAGFINKPSNQTIAEYTKENYDYCTKRSMATSMNDQFESTFQTQQIINNLVIGSNDLIAKSI